MADFLLVFDLDGTLVDSVPDLCAAVNTVLKELGERRGRPPLSREEVKGMVGDGAPALVARALAARGADPARLEAALPRFLELYEASATRLSRLYPDVPETLALLRRRGYRLAVCTNKPQHATLTVLRGFELLALFDGVAGGDRFAVKKPDPGHLLCLVAELGGRVERSAMIGDNENDAAAARGAKMPLVLMRHGYARVAPESLAADALLDHFAQLPEALAQRGLAP